MSDDIPTDLTAEIGVIGGSGLYEFLDDAVTVEVPTPFGPPSDPLVIGEVAGRRVAFAPEHPGRAQDRHRAAVSESTCARNERARLSEPRVP